MCTILRIVPGADPGFDNGGGFPEATIEVYTSIF